MHSMKQYYVAPSCGKQAKISKETLGVAQFSGEPAAGLHLNGEF